MKTFQRDQVNTLMDRLARRHNRSSPFSDPAKRARRRSYARHCGRLTSAAATCPWTNPIASNIAFIQILSHQPSLWNRCVTRRGWCATGKKPDSEAERFGRVFVLAIDEIQKIPQWSDTVKGLWDADRARNCPLHVVILGSAPLLMQSGLSESLAGRFEPIGVSHWSLSEMTDGFNFDLERYLYFGGYPESARFARNLDRWRNYILGALIEPNIERDILAMTRVDKPALLKRLFELGTAYSGQILSYTKMLGQLQDAGNTTTLARYLDLLSSAGLLTGLPKYSNRPHRRRASSPKLIVLNTALMTADSGYSFNEAQADRSFWGRIVESAVGAHLFNTASRDTRLYYWRDGSHEVDFVLQRGPRIIAIEVKSGTKPSTLRGMAMFKQRFRPYRSLLVGEGGIGLNEFLSVPANYWFEE